MLEVLCPTNRDEEQIDLMKKANSSKWDYLF